MKDRGDLLSPEAPFMLLAQFTPQIHYHLKLFNPDYALGFVVRV